MAEETELQRAVLYINENTANLPNLNNCDPTWNYIWDANLSLKIAETTQRQYPPQTLLPYTYTADPKRFQVAPYEECNTNFRNLPPESDKPPSNSESTPKIKSKPTAEKQQKCPVEGCGKAFRMPYELKRHSLVHSTDRPFKCDECGREFARKDYLNRHVKFHIREPKLSNTTFKCEPTESDISNNYQFNQNHQYVVKTEKNDPELIANLSLNKSTPPRSKSKPPPEKHNICPVEGCGKAFQMPYQLKRHSLTHSSDRPFKCEKCAQAFSRKDYMRKHLRTHFPKPILKPFKCDYPNCTKEFARNDKLVSHRITHMPHMK